jgi:hypothetical protein
MSPWVWFFLWSGAAVIWGFDSMLPIHGVWPRVFTIASIMCAVLAGISFTLAVWGPK